MELSGETLEAIGRYVRGNLGTWIRDIHIDRDIELRERTVRVEEELKAQRELMREGLAQSQKRIDLMQEQMDRRFDQDKWRSEQRELRQRTAERTQRDIHFPVRDEGQRNRKDPYLHQIKRRSDEDRRYMTRWFALITVMIAAIGVVVVVSWFV